ncbi:MAG: NAD(P)/FAD-dependent oxidoreductase [Bacteroidales bacterium]
MIRKRVVIIGGGFAGLRLATDLDEKVYDITLIDKNNYHQFQPLLYQVTSSGLEASSICFPFRKVFSNKKNVTFLLAEVFGVESDKKILTTSVGGIGYDHLVIATGTKTMFFGNESLERNAYSMKSAEEAMLVRNKILMQLERAALSESSIERERLLNIVIVGGGATGVEVAGVLSEMKRYVIPKYYKELKPFNIKIHLIEASSKLLGVMSEGASSAALSFLQTMGVDVMLNSRVVEYEHDVVHLSSGETISSSLVIWVSGVTGNLINGIPKDSIGRGNRIITDSILAIKGMDSVYAIGDLAMVEGDKDYPNGHPQVAQVAIQQGDLVANNLNRLANGKSAVAFSYRNMGSLATVGRNKAVADLPGIKMRGFFAWIIWLVVHLRSILGVKNKISVLMDWMWNYFSYSKSIRMMIFRGKRE